MGTGPLENLLTGCLAGRGNQKRKEVYQSGFLGQCLDEHVFRDGRGREKIRS